MLRLILPPSFYRAEDSNFEHTGVVDAISDAGGSNRVVLRQPTARTTSLASSAVSPTGTWNAGSAKALAL